MLNILLTLCFFVYVLATVASNEAKNEKIKQERNDAIVFCVENPNDCKVEYLKLK